MPAVSDDRVWFVAERFEQLRDLLLEFGYALDPGSRDPNEWHELHYEDPPTGVVRLKGVRLRDLEDDDSDFDPEITFSIEELWSPDHVDGAQSERGYYLVEYSYHAHYHGIDQRWESRYARIPLEAWLPMGDAMLRHEALFFESRTDFRERYPIAEKDSELETLYELSYACLPFVVHGRAIGGASLVFGGTRAFDEDERVFLTVLAHHAAQAVERASLFEREKAARERLQRLQQITAALSSVATVEEIAQLAARVVTDALGVSATVVWATDERGDLHLLGACGAREFVVESFRHLPADSPLPAARVARDRLADYHESDVDIDIDLATLTDATGRGAAFRAFANLPLVRDNRTLGVLGFSAGRPRRFSAEERSFAATIAEHHAP